MMPVLRITLTDESKAVRFDRRKLLRMVRRILSHCGLRIADCGKRRNSNSNPQSAIRNPQFSLVDIAVVGLRKVAALNRRFLRRRGATDVLAFNLGPSPLRRGRAAQPRAAFRPRAQGRVAVPHKAFVGQIVVCADVARREARRRGIRAEDELALYVAHGTLHLLGERDHDEEGRERMRRLAARYLIGGGYADVTLRPPRMPGRSASVPEP
jgi:rRNA maturation RNase YbeY